MKNDCSFGILLCIPLFNAIKLSMGKSIIYAGTTSKLRTVVVESEFHLAAKVLAPLWLLQQWWQLFFIFLLFLFLFIILQLNIMELFFLFNCHFIGRQQPDQFFLIFDLPHFLHSQRTFHHDAVVALSSQFAVTLVLFNLLGQLIYALLSATLANEHFHFCFIHLEVGNSFGLFLLQR